MERCVEPEILDSLPANDREAIRSRRDLRWINAIMGNHRWIARRVRSLIRPGWRVLELGAGDGGLGRRLIASSAIDPRDLCAVDLAPRPDDWPSEPGWKQQNIFAEPLPPAELVVANLFLHHFKAPDLVKLGRQLPKECRFLICSEPARRELHLWQGRLLNLLPLSPVTRHDMLVSIRAGFLHGELPDSLGLDGWKTAVSNTFFGAYRLEAQRV